MFDTLHTTYKKIISCIGIIGYLEEDIKKRGQNITKNLPLNCLYAYPSKEIACLNNLTYQMMFPDDNHKIPCPKFFTLTLTDQKAVHSYLYCLKFSETYSLKEDNEPKEEIDVPIVIFIKSQKEDLESFKQLLNIINYIIINDDLEKNGNINYTNISDFKKVQLMNLFYFIFCLPHTSPHSLVRLKLDQEIQNGLFDSIDFYFSSNCEIPCNKNDTDINILFLLLEQSIIIKVLFCLLIEKPIVFRASQSYLLNLIIPTFLKLLFPFKWLYHCITVLPKENIELLEAPGPSIFGVLSDVISINDLIREYPGKIIVDCDTNEIFGENYLEPFEPQKFIPNIRDEKDKKNKKEKGKKDKDGKEVREFLNNINIGNNFTQGNNLINVNGSFLYKYEIDPNIKKTKLNFGNTNIIIDSQNSQLLIDKTNIFIDSREWKWLRKNIQLVRNPEIFDFENIGKKKNNLNRIYLNEEVEDNIILPNRPFSYNIQNILMKFILNKLEYSESEFMSIFRNNNIFLAYNEPKKYQNNSGKRITENISDLKDQQRNINNSFIIEYTLPKFSSKIIINKIDEKFNQNIDINSNIKIIYEKIKTILNNYSQIDNEEEIENFNNYDGICQSERNGRKSNITQNCEGRKTEIRSPFGRITKGFTKGHERNKTSVLQETISTNTNFLLMGMDNSLKGVLKFYNENGFLDFINNFENFLKEENINIKNELYELKIFEQIKNIIVKNEDLFNQNGINISEPTISINQKNTNISNFTNIDKENNNINTSNTSYENNNLKSILIKKDTLNNKKKKKKVQMSIIPENDKEEEEIDAYDGRGTVIQRNDGGDFDFASNFMNNIKTELHLNLEGINENNLNDDEINKYIDIDEDIINFPNLIEQEENNENYIKEENEEKVNLKSQYYLFIAIILEEILESKEESEKLIEEIENNKNEKLDIKSLILKIYRFAYKFSGKKHRDFPYFSYYSFLSGLNLDELESLKDEFKGLTDFELFDILANIIIEQQKILEIKIRRRTRIQDKKDTINKNNQNKKEENTPNDIDLKKNENSNDLGQYYESNIVEKNKINNFKLSIDTNPLEFNCLISYEINSGSEFDCKNENMDWKIIKSFAQEMLSLLPKNKDWMNIPIQNILDKAHHKLKDNKRIFNLIGQLRYIDPGKIKLVKERICFWLNCFNYLILFTFFYKKWNIIAEKDWKYFFKNVKYKVGENNYSFHDMLYILYKNILFFPSSYKVNDNIKKYRVNKVDDAKIIEKKYPLLFNPFAIYVPIMGFIKPIIYDEHQLEKQFNQRIKEYFNNFLGIDYQKNIIMPELLLIYNPNFLYKEYKKYQMFIPPKIYEVIKDKKYKSINQINLKWKLNFDNLFENFNQDN